MGLGGLLTCPYASPTQLILVRNKYVGWTRVLCVESPSAPRAPRSREQRQGVEVEVDIKGTRMVGEN